MSWTTQPRKLADFGELLPAGAKLLAELDTGQECVIGGGGVPPEDPPRDVVIRASFLRWCILRGPEEETPKIRVHEKGIRVQGAYIRGDRPKPHSAWLTAGLDLEGCTIRGDLGLVLCRFPDMVLLRSAALSTLNLAGSHLMAGLSADGLQTTGAVFLRQVEVTGQTRLLSARIGGQLACDRGWFKNPGQYALIADGLETTGEVFLRQVTVTGETRLVGARIGGDLICDGGWFKNPGEDYKGQPNDALAINRAEIAGGFFWRDEARIDGAMDLTGARFARIYDDQECWPQKGMLFAERLELSEAPTTHADVENRLEWFKLQEPSRWGSEFWAHCYINLAVVLRDAGYEAESRWVMIRKEHEQRKARRVQRTNLLYRWLWWLIDQTFNVTVRYGRRPILAFAWLTIFWSVGALWFDYAQTSGSLKPNNAFVLRADEWVLCADAGTRRGEYTTQYACFRAQPAAVSYPEFNAVIYSLDTLLPIVALEMQGFWIPDEDHPVGFWARIYLWVQIGMGWALSLLAVAGFSGLIRSDSGK
ncbi:MAG: hypothetical protein AAFR46_05250 [Pseudomonadota bacterium]